MWGFLQPWSGEINGAQGGQSGRVHLPTQACWVRYSSYRPGGPFNLLSSKPILVDGIGLSFGTFFLDSDAAGIFTFTPRSTFFPSSAARVFHTPLRQSLTPRPPKANKLIHSLSLVAFIFLLFLTLVPSCLVSDKPVVDGNLPQRSDRRQFSSQAHTGTPASATRPTHIRAAKTAPKRAVRTSSRV